jgi:hypothetical protein
MRSITKLIFRLMLVGGFLLLLQNFISSLRNTIVTRQAYSSNFVLDLSILILSFLIIAFIYFVFWLKTDWVVKLLAGNMDDNSLTITTSSSKLFKIAIRFLGILLVVTSIPPLLGLAGRHLYWASRSPEYGIIPSEIEVQEIEEWIINGSTLLIGIGLMIGTKSFKKMFAGIGKWLKGNETEPAD